MKTVRRILIILAVFSALSALMFFAVNIGGLIISNLDSTYPQLGLDDDDEEDEFVRPEDAKFNPEGNESNPQGGEDRPEHGERGGRDGGFRWMFGIVKNIGVMAMLVTLIVLPKNLMKSKRKQAVIKSANDGT